MSWDRWLEVANYMERIGPWRSAARQMLQRDWLFAAALIPAIALRAVAELGYRWQAYFPDSIAYLATAIYNWPQPERISGYAVYLKILQPFHSLALVTLSQHLMGLLTGIMVYALARRYGAPAWLAVIAALPVLYDGFEIQLEHLIMSDTLFLFLVMLAVTLVTWWRRPPWWACLAAGLSVGLSVVVRSVGLPLVAVFAVFLIVRLFPARGQLPSGWRNGRGWLALGAGLLLFGLAIAPPVIAYEWWYSRSHAEFAMDDATGVFLYSRVMTFADCSRLSLSADLRQLCTTVPIAQRPQQQVYLWGSASPLARFGAEEFSPPVNKLAEQFAIKAIEGQPLDYARAVLADTVRSFGWNRTVYPDPSTYGDYLFGGQTVAVSATIPAQTGGSWNYAPNYYVKGDPQTGVVEPFATVIRVYQEYVWLPGTGFGLILLVGLGGMALAWRRAGGEATLPWAISLALIVVPAATAAFDYRYVLTAVPFACLAMAIAVGNRLRAPRPVTDLRHESPGVQPYQGAHRHVKPPARRSTSPW